MFSRCLSCVDKKEGCHDRCPYYVANKLVLMEDHDKKEKSILIRDQEMKSIIRTIKEKERGYKPKSHKAKSERRHDE